MPLLGTFGKRFQANFVLQSVLEYGSVIKIFIGGVSQNFNFLTFSKIQNQSKFISKFKKLEYIRGRIFGRGPANEYI
jgi:hypothetical protein